MADSEGIASDFPNFKKGNLVEKVFDSLKQKILSGSLKQGQLLPTQTILAQQFGVSRTVIREALTKLASLGLIKSCQGQGTFVQAATMQSAMGSMLSSMPLDEDTTRELMEARYYLEKVIVCLAAGRTNDEQTATLEATILDMEKALHEGNIDDVVLADVKFHTLLAEMSQNRVLKLSVDIIRKMLTEFLKTFNKLPGASERAVTYHKKIHHAIANGDAKLAELMMDKHMSDVLYTLKEEYGISVDV